MSISEGRIEKFIYFWEVKNPQFCPLPMGEFFSSPKFFVPQFGNSSWYLRLYPRGHNERDTNRISCYLHRGNDRGPETIDLKFSLIVSSEKITVSADHSFKNQQHFGFTRFLDRALSSYKKTILIMLEMQCEQLDSSKTPDERHSHNINDRKLPIKCFAQSEILHKTMFIQKSIDSVIRAKISKMAIPIDFPEKYPSLILNWNNNSEDVVEVNIALTGTLGKGSILACNISIRNSVGLLLYSFKGEHQFTATENGTWCITQHITLSHLKEHLNESSVNNIILKGEFSISVGEIVTEIVGVEHMKDSRNVITNDEYIPSDEAFKLMKEKKHCDFSLKIGKDVVPVHKIFLVAGSPVFAAMINNEMKEKKTGVVNIVDTDKETLEEMISFLYTGSVKKLEYERATKLYIAGDKYQISPLLDVVRKLLIGFINNDTIYDILAFSDTHSDKELEKEGVKFIKLNKSTILISSKWADFENENGSLAAKILRQVCLLNKRKRSF